MGEEREENKRKEEIKWAHEAKVQKRNNLEQQLAKLGRGRNPIEKAHVLFNLGAAHVALGHGATAREFYQRALDMFEQEYGTDFLHTRLCRRQLGRCPEPRRSPATDDDAPRRRGKSYPACYVWDDAQLKK